MTEEVRIIEVAANIHHHRGTPSIEVEEIITAGIITITGTTGIVIIAAVGTIIPAADETVITRAGIMIAAVITTRIHLRGIRRIIITIITTAAVGIDRGHGNAIIEIIKGNFDL